MAEPFTLSCGEACPFCGYAHVGEMEIPGCREQVRFCPKCEKLFEPEHRADPARQLCNNCAFRSGSGERADAWRWLNLLEDTVEQGRPFHCHKHLPATLQGDGYRFEAPKDHSELKVCAGWKAARAAFLAGRRLIDIYPPQESEERPMADKTPIEWTDATWNPITGCRLASRGCANCYAARLAATRMKNHPSRAGLARMNAAGVAKFNGKVRLNTEWLDQPLAWAKPRMIFVVAHGDLFYEAVPDAWIDQVMARAVLGYRHTYQILTKRADRMADYFAGDWAASVAALLEDIKPSSPWNGSVHEARAMLSHGLPGHVWLGVSVEDQAAADERRLGLALLARRGWRTWVSYEPALGAVDWSGWSFISWLVSGGESGAHAAPSHPDWHRAARDWCAVYGIPFLFKQWGEWIEADQLFDRSDRSDDVQVWRDGARWRPNRPLNFADAAWLGDFLGHPYEHHSDGSTYYRLSKSRSGRLLDGIEHNGFPNLGGAIVSRREIFILGIVYTLVMAAVVAFVPKVNSWVIVLPVANVWFWLGRLSVSGRPVTKWGR